MFSDAKLRAVEHKLADAVIVKRRNDEIFAKAAGIKARQVDKGSIPSHVGCPAPRLVSSSARLRLERYRRARVTVKKTLLCRLRALEAAEMLLSSKRDKAALVRAEYHIG